MKALLKSLTATNLLKKYREQEVASAAVNEKNVPEADAVDVEPETDHGCHEDLAEIGGYTAKESINDVTLAPNLIELQRAEFRNCVNQFSSLFTESSGATNLIEHHINLTTEGFVRSKLFPLPYSMCEELKKDRDDMIKMGVIRESTSSYSSPVVVAKKKDNKNRVFVDYRKLDKLTVVDPEPMPTAGELFHNLGGGKYFSRIDLSKGYWLVKVPEEDRYKTAFVTPDGSYELVKMSFGIVNSAATLKRGMKKLIADYYWDDIIVHNLTWKGHL